MPDDIVIKGLFESCADLNTVGGCSLAIQYCWGSSFGADKLALAACGFKLLTAYFGQFSHRESHARYQNKTRVGKWMQAKGLMISTADHHVHHTDPHDSNFCLIGVCQPLMNALAGYLPCYSHRKTYLILFLMWSVVDIPVIAFVVRAVLGQGSGVTGA